MSERTAAVLAGGLGTRIATLTGGATAKAMLPVCGRPFIDYKLEELRRAGVARVVLLLGLHADQIADYVGNGHTWGLDLSVVADGTKLRGTGGALQHALDDLPPRFWVTYGDTLLDADLEAVEERTTIRSWSAAMTVLRNRDRWQPSNVNVQDDLVVSYNKRAPAGSHQFIDYGLLFVEADSFRAVDAEVFDIDVVLQRLIRGRVLGAVEVTTPFHDIGTPEALEETEAWLRSEGRAHA